MKVFVTGATGFVGQVTARRLAAGGHELVCLVRDPDRAGWLRQIGASLVQGDITQPDELARAMAGCDWVINLANVYSLWEPDSSIYQRVNLEGTRQVMLAALQAKVAKVVHVSTVAIWGNSPDRPFNEDSPVGGRQFSQYARSKYLGDLAAWDLYHKQGLPLVMVYPAVVLGAGDPKSSGRYIADLVNGKLLATVYPDSVVTYVYVGDVAEVIVRAAEKPDNLGQKYIAAGQALSYRQFNQMVHEISGAPLPRLVMPNWLVGLNAALFTWLADLTKRPPIWGLCRDSQRPIQYGLEADGSKAQRELGITYTPIQQAVQEAVASLARETA